MNEINIKVEKTPNGRKFSIISRNIVNKNEVYNVNINEYGLEKRIIHKGKEIDLMIKLSLHYIS
jgi:hypothetical protein